MYGGGFFVYRSSAQRAPSQRRSTRFGSPEFLCRMLLDCSRSTSMARRSLLVCTSNAVARSSFPEALPRAVPVTGKRYIGGYTSMTRYAKRILVPLTPEQDAALRSRLVTLGVPVTEQIRRAVNLMLFADTKPRKKSSTKTSAEQPLFFEQKASA
jgi:hypothetical protein